MKPNLHPDYPKITVSLGDGSTMETFSTMKSDTFAPDIDATNHPFYTGKRQFLDTAGRVEKFMRRYGRSMPVLSEDAPTEDAPAASATATAAPAADAPAEDAKG